MTDGDPAGNGNGTSGPGDGQQGNGGQPRPGRNRRRRPQARPAPTDIWRRVGALGAPEPIAFPDDPAMLLRSLGDPPIGNGGPAGHYFGAAAERAAGVAYALALSVDLAAPPDED